MEREEKERGWRGRRGEGRGERTSKILPSNIIYFFPILP
jgi:hypothetical protein